jgi:hypothetical protein
VYKYWYLRVYLYIHIYIYICKYIYIYAIYTNIITPLFIRCCCALTVTLKYLVLLFNWNTTGCPRLKAIKISKLGSEYINHQYINHQYINHQYTNHQYIHHQYTNHQYTNHQYINHQYINHQYINHQFQHWNGFHFSCKVYAYMCLIRISE